MPRAPEIEPLAPGAAPELSAMRGVSRPTGPVEVRVRAAESHGALALQVIDRTGRVVDTVTVAPGTIDLLPLAPALTQMQETAWVQLLEDDRPVGAPLWITPLRAAPPVRTVRSIRPSNQQPYQRVVGWGDRALDPNDAETAAAMPAWTPADPVVTAGYRVEPAVEALLHTSEGPIRVGFAPDAAPATVENFLRLARGGFYDGTIFHRVVPLDREGRPFVVQGGDPTGTGDGGPGWNLALEPSDLRHERGVLGMARGDDPHSAGSQFYIALSQQGTARLDGQYCTFGFMLEGEDALDRIAQSEIVDAATGRPRTPPRIERVELLSARPCVGGADPHARPVAKAPAEPVSPSPTGER
jgi:peptidyl-prolyl cis-trans isomerase B (cyclophilin B)